MFDIQSLSEEYDGFFFPGEKDFLIFLKLLASSAFVSAAVYYKKENLALAVYFIFLCVMFQPILPLHFSREMWSSYFYLIAVISLVYSNFKIIKGVWV